ncbi:OprD family outer membrane porin [Acinetobacter stercoris]|uniref:Porin-like protein NicP n=1 Tax=Acinetobacter stercoris TaxID=2126983 RepID=A0A2U3N3P8_9GAMM|nr:OprD family outer membrane porin [Acinetobacter stercoris]SPL72179.1 Porin-like protein NicP precursor [Acinetobacter stercoris]
MKKKILLGMLVSSSNAFANDFIEDTKASLWTRNYYYDRNYTEISSVPALKEWAQGFVFTVESGYTSGKIGFGLDMQAMAGFKLHADSNETGAQILPVNKYTHEAADAYGKIGVTGKVKYSQTELKAGTLMPFTPVVFSSRARLLPQTFRGVEIQSKDIDNTLITLGWLDKVNQRDSSNYENIKISGANGKFLPATTDNMFYGGFQYNFDKDNLIGAYAADVTDLYRQGLIMAKSNSRINDQWNFLTDLKIYHSGTDGKKLAGPVDNTLFAGNFGLRTGPHTFSVGMLNSSGKTGFPYLYGGEVLFFLDGVSTDFLNPKEQVWSLRYDVDLKQFIEGMKFAVRYSRGDNIHLPKLGGTDLKEDEWAFDLQYTVPEHVRYLHGLSIRTRYAIYDNDFAPIASFKPDNELRIGIDYTWKF